MNRNKIVETIQFLAAGAAMGIFLAAMIFFAIPDKAVRHGGAEEQGRMLHSASMVAKSGSTRKRRHSFPDEAATYA